MTDVNGESRHDLMVQRDQALAALWRIRMAAETWRTDEPAGPFCNRLIVIALGGMGSNKRLAQELAAAENGGRRP